MTSPATRVPDVLDWLVANLPDICGVQVIEGAPGQGVQREHIQVMGGTIDQEYRKGSARRPGGPVKAETATVDLGIVSMLPGKTNSDARKRVFDLHGLIDERLRSNPMTTLTLGGLVCWVVFTPVEWVYTVGDQARGCALHSTLELHTPDL